MRKVECSSGHSPARRASLAGPAAWAALGVLVAAGQASAQATTGWQRTDAGPYDFNTASNWVGNSINGVFDPSLVLTANQAVTLAANNTVVPPELLFGYGGAYDLTIRSNSTSSRTLSVAGDITFAPAASGRVLTFGAPTDPVTNVSANPLQVIVTGTTLRTISAKATDQIVFNNALRTDAAVGGSNFGSATNTGTVVLNAVGTARTTGTFATLNGGTLVFGIENPFSSSASSKTMTVNAGTVRFAADNPAISGFVGYRYVLGGNATFVSDRTTAGAAVAHNVSVITTNANTATLTRGANVTSGPGAFLLGTTTLTGGTLALENVAVTQAASGGTQLTLAGGTLRMTIDSSYTQTATGGTGAIALTSGALDVTGTGTLGRYTLLQAAPASTLTNGSGSTALATTIADANYRIAITTGAGGRMQAIHKADNVLAADSATTLFAHVGDPSVALGVRVRNVAPADSDAFTYNLAGDFGTATNASRAAGGAADAGDAYGATVSTATAGLFARSATATPTNAATALRGAQTVSYSVQVNEYAAPAFQNAAGATLTGSGTSYTLDFGGSTAATLDLINAFLATQQDTLGGTFDLSNLGAFTVSGLDTSDASPLAAGLVDGFSIDANAGGTGYLLYTPTSLLNGSPTTLSTIRIDLSAGTAVPEPASLIAVVAAGAGLMSRRRC